MSYILSELDTKERKKGSLSLEDWWAQGARESRTGERKFHKTFSVGWVLSLSLFLTTSIFIICLLLLLLLPNINIATVRAKSERELRTTRTAERWVDHDFEIVGRPGDRSLTFATQRTFSSSFLLLLLLGCCCCCFWPELHFFSFPLLPRPLELNKIPNGIDNNSE